MKKSKLFSISFSLAFISTALLCIIGGHPLIFLPVSYGFIDFLIFGILIATLSFGLVFITLPIERLLRRLLKIKIPFKPYYLILTILLLQFLTLILGYLESDITRGIQADPFYYYKGVGNSLVYILTGNTTALIVASLYASDQERQENESNPKFDFEV